MPRVVLPPLLPQNVSDKREQRKLACSAERRNRRTSERRAELARTFLSEEEEDEVNEGAANLTSEATSQAKRPYPKGGSLFEFCVL